jgi:hypothetical protein
MLAMTYLPYLFNLMARQVMHVRGYSACNQEDSQLEGLA